MKLTTTACLFLLLIASNYIICSKTRISLSNRKLRKIGSNTNKPSEDKNKDSKNTTPANEDPKKLGHSSSNPGEKDKREHLKASDFANKLGTKINSDKTKKIDCLSNEEGYPTDSEVDDFIDGEGPTPDEIEDFHQFVLSSKPTSNQPNLWSKKQYMKKIGSKIQSDQIEQLSGDNEKEKKVTFGIKDEIIPNDPKSKTEKQTDKEKKIMENVLNAMRGKGKDKISFIVHSLALFGGVLSVFDHTFPIFSFLSELVASSNRVADNIEEGYNCTPAGFFKYFKHKKEKLFKKKDEEKEKHLKDLDEKVNKISENTEDQKSQDPLCNDLKEELDKNAPSQCLISIEKNISFDNKELEEKSAEIGNILNEQKEKIKQNKGWCPLVAPKKKSVFKLLFENLVSFYLTTYFIKDCTMVTARGTYTRLNPMNIVIESAKTVLLKYIEKFLDWSFYLEKAIEIVLDALGLGVVYHGVKWVIMTFHILNVIAFIYKSVSTKNTINRNIFLGKAIGHVIKAILTGTGIDKKK